MIFRDQLALDDPESHKHEGRVYERGGWTSTTRVLSSCLFGYPSRVDVFTTDPSVPVYSSSYTCCQRSTIFYEPYSFTCCINLLKYSPGLMR